MADKNKHVDLFVIGGGINGAAIARDAIGRGLSVMLAEKNDYASATSSASSKLIHGGLRYLEHFELSLVREALGERETMLKIAPHLTKPMRFLVPVTKDQSRPAWMVWTGLKIYDLLSGNKLLASSGRLSSAEVDQLPRLRKQNLTSVLHYADCWVDDARLVLETLLDARTRGADIANQRSVEKIETAENGYYVHYSQDGHTHIVLARFVVNTGGPWANDVADSVNDILPRRDLKLVRGSHIVLNMPKPADTTAFTLQNNDGRVIFTIPWQGSKYLVIGTTDQSHTGDPVDVSCSPLERDYLLDCYNRYFAHPGHAATAHDVIWSWAGVRSLVGSDKQSLSKVTRQSKILAKPRGTGGFVMVYGGKLTTHRRLAEKIMKKLEKMGTKPYPSWTATAPLHGGRYDRETLSQMAEDGPDFLPKPIRQRWAFTYGDQIEALFEAVRKNKSHAKLIAPGILEAELHHVVECEDAKCAEDFLIRRTKLDLTLTPKDKAKVNAWFSKLKQI